METIRADSDDAKFWVALSQIKGLSNANLCQLLTRLGSPESIFNASMNQLKEVVSAEIASTIKQGLDIDAIQPTLDWLKKDHAHLITLADTSYPQSLLQINNPPAVLYGIGHLRWLNHPAIAIVGSRNATPQGEKNAENLCNQGLCVVSGMALGIDGAAHRGALKSNGATIAVIGTGLDIVYPAKHRGSMITARLATEQGREVFAIPGSIHSPVSKGCHHLIKQGAKLVESSTDILEELKHLVTEQPSSNVETIAEETTSEAHTLLNAMGFDPISFEALLEVSGLTTEALSAMLMVLELESKVTTLSGAHYQRLI